MNSRAGCIAVPADKRIIEDWKDWLFKGLSRHTTDSPKDSRMADHIVPHFANDMGAEKVTIGVKELQCMGARAPYDHPHVFLDMGAESQVLCPYCSTLFIHDSRLAATESEPAGCIVSERPEHD